MKIQRKKDLNTHRFLSAMVMFYFYKDEPQRVSLGVIRRAWLQYNAYGHRTEIIKFVIEICKKQGWLDIHKDLFENWDRRGSKFLQKIDRILKTLVAKRLLEKLYDQFDGKPYYKLQTDIGGFQYPDITVEKLRALSIAPASNCVPQVLLKKMTKMQFQRYEDTNGEYVKSRHIDYVPPAENSTIDLMYLEERSITHNQEPTEKELKIFNR